MFGLLVAKIAPRFPIEKNGGEFRQIIFLIIIGPVRVLIILLGVCQMLFAIFLLFFVLELGFNFR